MPSFRPEEKERLREQLLVAARQHFVIHGLKKTSLEDLTRAIGVAKSTFYLFFDSKEQLYLELLEQDGKELEERVWGAVARARNSREAVKNYLQEMTEIIGSNPLMQRLSTHPDELQMVARKVTPEFMASKLKRNVEPLLTFVAQEQQAGHLIEKDPAVIVGVMRAAMLIAVHKNDIGATIYPEVADLLFDAVASALTRSTSESDHQ
uniref:TetR family transcriptional regulator n=1 Tax=Thermosporothrix sp. COM3 TaxID=2490863 RepID=A0A455SD00_9CHLR|nr:TetR family transcriptional regulator [Thermosporothrix sp. COM3]